MCGESVPALFSNDVSTVGTNMVVGEGVYTDKASSVDWLLLCSVQFPVFGKGLTTLSTDWSTVDIHMVFGEGRCTDKACIIGRLLSFLVQCPECVEGATALCSNGIHALVIQLVLGV